MKKSLVLEAEKYLDQLYSDLSEELKFEKSGEEFFRRMQWQIRRNNNAVLGAIKLALGAWLYSKDEGKFNCALDLIDELQAVEHINAVEEIKREMIAGKSRWSSDAYLDYINVVLNSLKKASSKGTSV